MNSYGIDQKGDLSPIVAIEEKIFLLLQEVDPESHHLILHKVRAQLIEARICEIKDCEDRLQYKKSLLEKLNGNSTNLTS